MHFCGIRPLKCIKKPDILMDSASRCGGEVRHLTGHGTGGNDGTARAEAKDVPERAGAGADGDVERRTQRQADRPAGGLYRRRGSALAEAEPDAPELRAGAPTGGVTRGAGGKWCFFPGGRWGKGPAGGFGGPFPVPAGNGEKKEINLRLPASGKRSIVKEVHHSLSGGPERRPASALFPASLLGRSLRRRSFS